MPCQNHPGVNEGLVACWRCRREFCYNCAVELHDYYFCADCKTAQVRDLLAGTDLFSLDYAPLEKRFLAWLIDGAIKFVILGVFFFLGIMVAISANGSAGIIQVSILSGHIAGMLYEALLSASTHGQTLGKTALNIKIVTAEGNPISTRLAWWRAVLKLFFYYITCGCPAGLIFDGIFTLSQERTSLHDLGARTRVVNA